jgi:hypothetical protein
MGPMRGRVLMLNEWVSAFFLMAQRCHGLDILQEAKCYARIQSFFWGKPVNDWSSRSDERGSNSARP